MPTHFTSRVAAATAGAALLAFLTAGCHDDTPPPTAVVTPPTASTTTVVPGSVPSAGSPGVPDTKVNTNAGPGGSTGTDAALADQINTAIVHNKQMTGSRVEVVAATGIVTLNGTVQNQQQKGLAQTTAQNVPGVGSIKNKLMIVTTGGAKPKPMVVTKTKTVVIHDQAPAQPADGTGTAPTDSTQTPPDTSATDPSSTPPAPPATTTGQ